MKFAALLLAVAVVGLPVNSSADYGVLAVAAIVIFSGTVRLQGRSWLGAAAIVAVAIAGQMLLATPRIDEGHNVFLPDEQAGVLERELPAPVYRRMKEVFDAAYPLNVRCDKGSTGCWRNGGVPDRLYAFSADGIFHRSPLSRAVLGIDFTDPVWLGLGFSNEHRYNWYTTAPDVHRADRNRFFWNGYRRWEFAMPWFETIVMPAVMTGGQLCWRGELMWEGANGNFSSWPGEGCRSIEPADAGRRIYGLAIKPNSLAMRFTPPVHVRALQIGSWVLSIAAVIGIIFFLVNVRPRRALLPFAAVGLAALVIALDDASFFGGLRPMDGGDDGLFYDGVGRVILQKFLAGDIAGALEGGESVFYYGGPGLRYFRALEHVIFGETFLGFLTILLVTPFIVYFLFRRFLPQNWSLLLAFCFIAVPTGMMFGTTFVNYAKLAARGYADPMAYILFIAGIVPIIGFVAPGPDRKFMPAFCGALLLALGIFMKPIIAPAAAVLLGGAGLYALYLRQWPRLAGLCIGFLPVLSMPLHNWIYGKVFVLFSSNAGNADLLVMRPSAYLSAAGEVLTLNFTGPNLKNGFFQIVNWLSGPAESVWTIPLNAAGVTILVYVVLRGRNFDPWLRLIGAAALAQHSVALFYNASIGRYHYLTWFLTMLVVMVFFYQVGFPWLSRRYPALSERFLLHPLSRRFANGVARLEKVSS
ncbi:MAG: hypothetical protein Q7T81_00680 [Pseudolabrys sp.]|nr:hypothetical protein [Pseudolabrys sp.]